MPSVFRLVALALVLCCGFAQAAEPFLTQALAINSELRQSSPAQPLTLDPTLCQAAQGYANLQARNGTRGHFADEGPEQRAKRAGFTGTLLFNERPGQWYFDGLKRKREVVHDVGEVLCYGAPTAELAFQAWMESKVGHREAILNPSFNRAGYGVAVGAGGQLIWVGLLGRVEE